jgi:hypothetical protein
VSVRAGFFYRSGLLLLLCGQLAGCPTRSEYPPGAPVIIGDAGTSDLTGRTVVQDPPDAPFQRDADLPPIGANEVAKDAGRQFSSDVRIPRDGFTGVTDAPPGCSVVKQDCGAMKGCYPTPETGGAKCYAAGQLNQGVECADHKQCAPGLVCVEAGDAGSLCVRGCDKVRNTGCISPDVCHGYDGDIGYCAP